VRSSAGVPRRTRKVVAGRSCAQRTVGAANSVDSPRLRGGDARAGRAERGQPSIFDALADDRRPKEPAYPHPHRQGAHAFAMLRRSSNVAAVALALVLGVADTSRSAGKTTRSLQRSQHRPSLTGCALLPGRGGWFGGAAAWPLAARAQQSNVI